MINNFKEEDIVNVLHKGLLSSVEARLKSVLYNEVDSIVKEAMRDLYGMVQANMDPVSHAVTFNISVNHPKLTKEKYRVVNNPTVETV